MARVARGGGVSEAHSVWFRRSTMRWGRWDGIGRLLQHIVQGEANRIEGHDAAQRDPHPPAPPEHPYHTVSAAVLRRGTAGPMAGPVECTPAFLLEGLLQTVPEGGELPCRGVPGHIGC